MLPDTAVGVLVLLVAVMPGAVYTWEFERRAGAYGVTLADRTLRFISVSVVFHLLAAWPEYGIFRATLAHRQQIDAGQFALLWGGAVLLVVVPAAFGSVLGGLYDTRHTRAGWRLVRRYLSAELEHRLRTALLGPENAPRAWDELFSQRPNVYVRVRTTDGTWLAGLFASASYAGGFPNDTDLLLEEAWTVDQDDGRLGEHGLGYPVYVPASRIAWLEIVRPAA